MKSVLPELIAGTILGALVNSLYALAISQAADSPKVLYWHDPMVPGHRFDKPGKSPVRDGQLVPVYARDARSEESAVSDLNVQSPEIRSSEVKKSSVAPVAKAVAPADEGRAAGIPHVQLSPEICTAEGTKGSFPLLAKAVAPADEGKMAGSPHMHHSPATHTVEVTKDSVVPVVAKSVGAADESKSAGHSHAQHGPAILIAEVTKSSVAPVAKAIGPTTGGVAFAGNSQSSSAPDSAAGKKVLYWHDPMVPGHKFDKPGKSPFMDMQLVPVYADDAGDEGKAVISSRMQQSLGIRTAEVKKASLAPVVEAVGSVAYNERDIVLVQARSNGFVEKLYARAQFDRVRKGEPLADLYVPDWIAAQEEYLAASRMRGSKGMMDAARQRMRLAGMNDDQIRLVESSRKLRPRVTITAPATGVVAELAVREGATVMAGAPMFRINGLETVWVNADVPENLLPQVRPGNAVEARIPSLPGAVFEGKVSAILPEINQATRTVRARVDLKNPEGKLLPGMFASVNFTSASRQEELTVPAEAVIQTGKRAVVMVAEDDGKFVPVDVEIGIEANGQTEIRKGLKAGQKVVVSGQFLIDSEASLKSAASRASGLSAPAGNKADNQTHRGEGKVESIGKDQIMLSHGPMPSLQWGSMTMGFRLPANGLPGNIKVGDSVVFAIRQTSDGMFELTTISSSATVTR
jgi:Cu(I)/Ag(I) efflux system membrane fusion protein